MGYIGHSPTNAGSYIEVDDFGSSFNGSNVAFTLQVGSVDITPNQQNLLVILDGVVQQPLTAYSVSGSTITFTEAPANGTDLYCVLMGQSASIGQGTIGADELKISGNGTSGQLLKSDGDGTYSYLNQTSVTSGTATTLATARTINGVSFDGSANITVTADANTLSNTTLKSTVVNSSLTSVGTLTSLTSSGTISSSTSSTTDSALTLTDAGVADYKFTFPDTSTIRLSTSTSSDKTLDITNAGSGAFGLSVEGNTTFSGDVNVTADGARFFVSSADYELVSIGRAGSSGSALDQAYIRLKNAGTNTVALHTAGNSYFNGGNVGIGTDSPGYQLDLRRNDTGTATSLGIRQLGTGDASMAFQTTTSPYGFCIGVDGSDSDAFKIATGTDDVGTNTKLTITSDGFVGINRDTNIHERLTVGGQVCSVGSNSTSSTSGSQRAIMDITGNGARIGHFRGSNGAGSGSCSFFVDSSSKMHIDSAGSVGINTTSPTAMLDIANTANNDFPLKIRGNIDNSGGFTGIKFGYEADTGNYEKCAIKVEGTSGNVQPDFHILLNSGASSADVSADNTDAKFSVYNGGYVTVGGSTTNNVNLTVNGTSSSARVVPQTDNTGYLGESNHRWQAVYATNGSIQTSDKNLKTSITSTDLGLDFINKLNPVSYKWKVGGYDITEATLDEKTGYEKTERIETPVSGKRKHYGLIAQEVKEVLGNNDFGGWVKEDLEDDDSLESLRYDQFVAPLVKAVQELSAQNDLLTARIEALEA